MSVTIKIKSSTTPASVPSSLADGEIAINRADGKLFYSDPLNIVRAIEGTEGPIGPKGDTGEQGIQGIQGIQGEQGPKGDKGDTGEQGIQGIQGPAGTDGAQGDVGPEGPKGEKGDTGQGFSIAKTYPTVAALEADTAPTGILPGEFAAVVSTPADPDNGRIYLWDGTVYSFVMDLSGAEGIQGPKGDTGEQGIQGIQGIPGTAGADGAQGPEGPIGPKGDTGEQGIQGIQGEQGIQGPKGDTGAAGPTLYQDQVNKGTFTGTETEWTNLQINNYLASGTVVLDGGTF